MAEALVVERVAVRPGRLSLLVRVSEGYPHYATPQLAAYVSEHYPALAYHTCVNEVGPTFGAVMPTTSLPHLLEHLIIDEQVNDPETPSNAALLGTTEWRDERAGLARIEVNFSDDFVALRALRSALAFLNRGMEGN